MSPDDEWTDDYGDEQDSFQDSEQGRSEAFDDGSPETRKQGMSTGVKVLLGLLCVGGVFFLLCCGVFVYFGSKMKFEINKDAEVAAQVASDIVDIDIPETFKPTESADMDMLFMTMKFVSYERDAGSGKLILMQMEMSIGDQEQQRTQMRQQMNNQNMGQRNLVIKKSETREFEIRGEAVEFLFSEAVDPESEIAYREVTGTFEGKNGVVLFLLQVGSDVYDEEEITKMIESIK